MKKLQEYGGQVEEALRLHFDFDVPLRECVSNENFVRQWNLLLDTLEKMELVPIEYEREIKSESAYQFYNEGNLYIGFVDIVVKHKKTGDVFFIEVKTRNLKNYGVLESDRLQLAFYLTLNDLTVRKEAKTYEGYIMILDRNEPVIEVEKINVTKKNKGTRDVLWLLAAAVHYYDLFIRDKIDEKFASFKITKGKK